MVDEVRNLFIEVYKLDAECDQIATDEPLFGLSSRFGLDSMDTLRFIAVLHERYGLDIGSTNTDSFRTLDKICETLEADRKSANEGG
ncbi:acyl carrier protein [Murinocardiopsis flavida]|uniref:Acyl carrier protein n=1 Tax=Murinocardiopsis flavida TaxID=645275 RepID=A0A2P8D555_9ACTN|nr:phosphopantetheine-binding protein [Murinocardiopsis flavida]PSK92347.1 acyl carrier protein [Murinocardiopsis flavida]